MIAWIGKRWRALQRRLDVLMLWPPMVRIALQRGHTVEFARAAFLDHCDRDPAWLDLDSAQRWMFVNALEPPE